MPPSARPCGSCCAGRDICVVLAATEEDTVYRLYYDFDQPIAKLAGPPDPGHQPGREGGRPDRHRAAGPGAGVCRLLRRAVVHPGVPAMEFVKAAGEDAYDRLIYPSLEREARSPISPQPACEGAIGQLRPEPEAPADAAAGEGQGDHGPGPRLSAWAARWRWWTAPARCWTPPWCIPPTATGRSRRPSTALSTSDPPATAWTTSPSATAPPAGKPSRWRWS